MRGAVHRSIRDTPESSVGNLEVCDLHRGLRGIFTVLQTAAYTALVSVVLSLTNFTHHWALSADIAHP
jgi:hypothetical protein